MKTPIPENFQQQFNGFYRTPHLFLAPVQGLQPFLTTIGEVPTYNGAGLERIRLGQRVERFVTTELLQDKGIKVVAENLQIQTKTKHTIGELDLLCNANGQLTHVEIQFKYYLYDATLGTTEIARCIGPMRRDTLNQKLTKLKEKQLPLLHAVETEQYIKRLGYRTTDFVQRIYFKAQLFIPYGKKIVLKTLNPECIYGYYVTYAEFERFKDCEFYKPKKTDWLLDVQLAVGWISYSAIVPTIRKYESEAYAPMLWIKQKNNIVIKCFVVL